MNDKTKNPLYVVKGKDVLEVKNILELVVEKLNLGPVIEMLKMIMDSIVNQIQSYAMLAAFNEFFQDLLKKIDEVLNLAQTFVKAR